MELPQRFDPGTIKPDRVVMVVGHCTSCAATQLADIMVRAGVKEIDVAMSRTFAAFASAGFRKPKHSTPVFEGNLLQPLFVAPPAGEADLEPVTVLLHDCLAESAAFQTSAIRQLMFNGRHYRIAAYMSTTCEACEALPEVKGNVDYVVAQFPPSRTERERLYEAFFSVYRSFDDFDRVFSALHRRHPNACLVVDNTVRIPPDVFWYDATPSSADTSQTASSAEDSREQSGGPQPDDAVRARALADLMAIITDGSVVFQQPDQDTA